MKSHVNLDAKHVNSIRTRNRGLDEIDLARDVLFLDCGNIHHLLRALLVVGFRLSGAMRFTAKPLGKDDADKGLLDGQIRTRKERHGIDVQGVLKRDGRARMDLLCNGRNNRAIKIVDVILLMHVFGDEMKLKLDYKRFLP